MQAKGKGELRGEAKKSDLLQKKLNELQSFELEHEKDKEEDSATPKKKTVTTTCSLSDSRLRGGSSYGNVPATGRPWCHGCGIP